MNGRSTGAPLEGVTVAFDLDGTLVDTAPDLVGALNAVLRREGLREADPAALRTTAGRGARALLEAGWRASDLVLPEQDYSRLFDQFLAAYESRIARESRPFPGAVQAIEQLTRAGARLCVCTNKRTALAVSLLDRLGLSPRFGAIVGADAAPAPKPDPRHLVAAVTAAGGDAARSALIGDSLADVEAARGAGAISLVAAYGYIDGPASALGGEHVIFELIEAPELILRIFATG